MSVVLKPAEERAIKMISKRYGSLKDIPKEFRQVIWVTAYKASAIGLKIERDGGAEAITKNILLDGGRDAKALKSSVLELQFLDKMVENVRTGKGIERYADAQLVVDVLKWKMEDVTSMSRISRIINRIFAKADKLYDMQVPKKV